MEFLKKNKINILYFVVLIAYAVIIFTTGYYHEPWADEAQSFLHARDYSFKELIFEQLKYEGHPIVWYAIIRIILLTKIISSQVLYENLFIITCTLNILAVYLLLFKSKMPTFMKVLLPFTFFIIYQYPLVARNHSLVFPMLAIIAIFYKNRKDKPYIYSILLILLANISAYTFVLSGILLMFFLYEIWKENKLKVKKYIPIFCTGIFLILTMLYLKRPEDCAASANLNFGHLGFGTLLKSIHSCFFNYQSKSLYIIQTIIAVLFYVFTIKVFCRRNFQILLFLSINLSLFFLQTILYVNDWHQGYAIIFYIFSLWIISDENTKFINKYDSIFVMTTLVILFVQIYWGAKCCYFDIKYKYCPSKDVAEYIKETKLDEKNIASVGFKSVAIQPYFEKNIFYNLENRSIYFWNTNVIKKDSENIFNKVPDALIVPQENNNTYVDAVLMKDYKKNKQYCGYLFSKGKVKESNCFIVYEKKIKE